jgi:hypothetical protein
MIWVPVPPRASWSQQVLALGLVSAWARVAAPKRVFSTVPEMLGAVVLSSYFQVLSGVRAELLLQAVSRAMFWAMFWTMFWAMSRARPWVQARPSTLPVLRLVLSHCRQGPIQGPIQGQMLGQMLGRAALSRIQEAVTAESTTSYPLSR